jgi:hypothetical protein
LTGLPNVSSMKRRTHLSGRPDRVGDASGYARQNKYVA